MKSFRWSLAVGSIATLVSACGNGDAPADTPAIPAEAPVAPETEEPPGPTTLGRLDPRRDTQGRILTDTFDVVHDLRGSRLAFALRSDLPDATRVMVSVGRLYTEVGSDDNYVLTYFSESSTVGQWRTPRSIALDNAAVLTDLEERQKVFAQLGEPFTVASISPEITIGFTVPINQEPPFEARNANLVGPVVDEGRFGRVIRREVFLPYPMDVSGLDDTRWADPLGLEEGRTYLVSRSTPVMPSRDPEDPLAAIAAMQTLPAGQTFVVEQVSDTDGDLWYLVDADVVGVRGWINSIALLGQDLVER